VDAEVQASASLNSRKGPPLKIVKEVVWASMAGLDGYGEKRGFCFHQDFNP